ncbi:MAG: M50 family metallopeptidase [Myxococcaceae bacterium]
MRYLYAFLALQVLLALHEASHALVARLCGVGVRRCAIGFGPPLFSFRKGGTLFAVCAVPLGAFTLLADSGPSAFGARPMWKRALVLLAGPFSNFAIAFGVLFLLHLAGTHVLVPMTVGTIQPGSEAARAGLRPGDRVVALDGQPVERWSDLVAQVSDAAERPIELTVAREGQSLSVQVAPRADDQGVGRLGLSQQYVYREHPPGEAAARSLAHVGRLFGDGAAHLLRVLRGGRSAWLPQAVPLFNQASDVAATGLDAFLRVAVALSLGLGVLSLLPLPSLDGGRLVLLLVEAVTHRRPGPRLEVGLHAAGFVLLALALIALAARGIAAGP